MDEDRVENLRRAIVECIVDFQRKHHGDEVSVVVAEQEILKAIADGLGYYVAAIKEGKAGTVYWDFWPLADAQSEQIASAAPQ